MLKKIIVDLLLALLFVCLLGFRHTGGLVHEWVGIVFFGAVAAHGILNFRWYKNIFAGSYGFRRGVNTVLNMALLVDMVILCVSGILNSSHVFKAFQLSGGIEIRQIHSSCAYWALILFSIHIGLHWKRLIASVHKITGVAIESQNTNNALRGFALVFALYGIWASFDRNMGDKLFLGAAFDFWSPDKPLLLFYSNNVSIMGLYIFATHLIITAHSRTRRDKNGRKHCYNPQGLC